jgi:hypothetical protein
VRERARSKDAILKTRKLVETWTVLAHPKQPGTRFDPPRTAAAAPHHLMTHFPVGRSGTETVGIHLTAHFLNTFKTGKEPLRDTLSATSQGAARATVSRALHAVTGYQNSPSCTEDGDTDGDADANIRKAVRRDLQVAAQATLGSLQQR